MKQTPSAAHSQPLRVVIMRGGTSRGPVVVGADLPADPDARDELLLRLVGCDEVQVDGVGGGGPTTSKVVVVDPAETDDGTDVDFDYAVGNVVVGKGQIDWEGTCGNMTASVPLYAIEEGLLASSHGGMIRLRNLATGKLVETELLGDRATHTRGDPVLVRTTYVDPGASVFDSVLPTGAPLDTLLVDGVAYECSIVDVTHPYLMVSYAAVIGEDAPSDRSVVRRIEAIRGAACVSLRRVDRAADAERLSPAVPRVLLVHDRHDDHDELRITAVSMGRPIGAVPVTAAMCLTAARGIPGTLVNRLYNDVGDASILVVSGPSASMTATAVVDDGGRVRSASVERTTRSILRGVAWV